MKPAPKSPASPTRRLEHKLGGLGARTSARARGRVGVVRPENGVGVAVQRADAAGDPSQPRRLAARLGAEPYDALFLFAVVVQAAFLILRLGTWAEARVILAFHLTGTAMALVKIAAGSWTYPEDAIFRLWGVPLFSGFMHASVGSFMARAIRVCEMRFPPYPPVWQTVALAVAIYVNFFAHHWLPDARWLLFAATVLVFGRTWISYRITEVHRMPLVLAGFLSSLMPWIAENIGTRTGTWLYAGQETAQLVSFAKIGSWYLLLYVSFVTVALAAPGAVRSATADSRARSAPTERLRPAASARTSPPR